MTTIPACTHNRFGCCYLCSDHLSWWKEVRIKKGYGETPPNAPVSPCSVRGCTSQKLYAKGYCQRHYNQRYRQIAGKGLIVQMDRPSIWMNCSANHGCENTIVWEIKYENWATRYYCHVHLPTNYRTVQNIAERLSELHHEGYREAMS